MARFRRQRGRRRSGIGTGEFVGVAILAGGKDGNPEVQNFEAVGDVNVVLGNLHLQVKRRLDHYAGVVDEQQAGERGYLGIQMKVSSPPLPNPHSRFSTAWSRSAVSIPPFISTLASPS